ncbi:MAG: lamin tail domain-containing protein, partial [Shimia sp.]|nr:lamin tail domain-containing protein [Shimia sp.]
MAANDATLADEDGQFSDWIEIHNPTGQDVDL